MAIKSRSTQRPMKRWARLSGENLLQMRICDLGLSIEGSMLEPRINRLYRELQRRDLSFEPHFWLSDDWFCPDGIPGVSIPFFLAHPRLVQLEKEFIMEVEGGSARACMKLLRHETGHAIANAYKLTERRDWRKMFGNPNAAYHDTYLPKPYSKRYVNYLPNWYAQSHPMEDWAETFAVWLDPKIDWKKRYRNWPALKKLNYVNEVMTELQGRKPILRNRREDNPVHKIRLTLGEFYEEKVSRYGTDTPEFSDVDLRKLFVDRGSTARRQKASRYIRAIRKPVLEVVERWTNEYRYRINEVLREMIKRCDTLGLYVPDDRDDMLADVAACVTMVVMNKLYSGGFHLTR